MKASDNWTNYQYRRKREELKTARSFCLIKFHLVFLQIERNIII